MSYFSTTLDLMFLSASSVSCFDFFFLFNSKKCTKWSWRMATCLWNIPVFSLWSLFPWIRGAEQHGDDQKTPALLLKTHSWPADGAFWDLWRCCHQIVPQRIFVRVVFNLETCYRLVSWQHCWHKKNTICNVKAYHNPAVAKLGTFYDSFPDDVVLQTRL